MPANHQDGLIKLQPEINRLSNEEIAKHDENTSRQTDLIVWSLLTNLGIMLASVEYLTPVKEVRF